MSEQDSKKELPDMLTTQQAAEYLGYKTTNWVTSLIRQGRLKAEKFGNVWMINKRDLDDIKDVRQGRPPKDDISKN
jgi:excisionase family DNA binding protein